MFSSNFECGLKHSYLPAAVPLLLCGDYAIDRRLEIHEQTISHVNIHKSSDGIKKLIPIKISIRKCNKSKTFNFDVH